MTVADGQPGFDLDISNLDEVDGTPKSVCYEATYVFLSDHVPALELDEDARAHEEGVMSRPAPAEAPAGYIGWPLWYRRVCLVHNRAFGWLFIAGLALGAGFPHVHMWASSSQLEYL
jgi:hypothetical protein